ncbi:MAG TPA: SRPBCC family protein [Ilumatobacter sp.]|nr:SRPBCC family protein [Ilumatobacter sp.]
MSNAERVLSIARDITAPATTIFDLLADPARHGEFDGSGTVQEARGGTARLTLGSKFGMDMKVGLLPYRITSTVVEFSDNELIAWEHFGKHRWRYQLEPLGDGTSTRVTESFDWSTARSTKFIELMGYPKKHRPNIERTLARLAEIVEA